MALTQAAVYRMLSALSGTASGNPITHMSIHSADPGTGGTSQIGTRVAVSFSAPSGSGPYSLVTSAQVQFTNIAANTTVTHVGFWDALTTGNFMGSADVTDELFSNTGTYTVTSATIQISGS